MPIVAVNGGGNTPNGRVYEAHGAYLLTGVEHTAREFLRDDNTLIFSPGASEPDQYTLLCSDYTSTPQPEAAGCLSEISVSTQRTRNAEPRASKSYVRERTVPGYRAEAMVITPH
jgi:hypothetical protein